MEHVVDTVEVEQVVELSLAELARVGGGSYEFDDANSGGAGYVP